MNPPASPSRGRERDEPPYEPPPLHLVVHAEPGAVLIVRRSLRQWLDALAWPEPDSDDVVIAVNEACANAIEHAYPPEKLGRVEIDGRLVESVNQRQVTLVVHDGGRWRPVPVVQRFRGHGLTVMRGCMHTVNIEPGIEGTAVTLTSFAVPPQDEKRRQH